MGVSSHLHWEFYLENERNPQAGRRTKFLDHLNRIYASLIFRARTRMLKVKHNFRNVFQDTKCRLRGTEEETVF